MTETIHLMPPETGPRSDPVLFAVAAALAELFPLLVLPPQAVETPQPRTEAPAEPRPGDAAGR